MKPINNYKITNPSLFRKFTSKIANSRLMLPVIILETTVVAGRTRNAYKRGGKDEARERVLEEVTGSVFWLGGIKMFGALGDFIGKKCFGLKDVDYDAGSDMVRNPIKNLPNGVNAKKYAKFKLAKILSSVLVATTFLGFVVPKINHKITNTIFAKQKRLKEQQKNKSLSDNLDEKNILNKKNSEKNKNLNALNKNNVNFKALPNSVAGWAHNLENHPIYSLLSMDTGVFVGRGTNARNHDERNEILFRDGTSSFFYLGCSPLVFNGLKSLDNKFCKGNSSLDQMTSAKVHNYLLDNMEEIGKYELSVEEFRNFVFGNFDKKTFDNLKFDNGVIKLSDFLTQINDETLIDKAKKMSELQYVQKTGAILTKTQAEDVLSSGWINNPEFLSDTLNHIFGSDSKSKILSNPKKFIDNNDVDSARKQILDYVNSICEYASKKSSKITPELMLKVNRRNMLTRGAFGMVAFGTSALFLSTIIPKTQYLITKIRTGKNEFPGTRTLQNEINSENTSASKKEKV